MTDILYRAYMDGPDRDTAPFTVDEVRRVVEAVHASGATVTAQGTAPVPTMADNRLR